MISIQHIYVYIVLGCIELVNSHGEPLSVLLKYLALVYYVNLESRRNPSVTLLKATLGQFESHVSLETYSNYLYVNLNIPQQPHFNLNDVSSSFVYRGRLIPIPLLPLRRVLLVIRVDNNPTRNVLCSW